MSDILELQVELGTLLPGALLAALGTIGLPGIAADDVEQNIARLARHVSPSYLPFATFDGSPLAIHVSPGVHVAASPVVYIETGSRVPKFVCGRFSDLACGAWLWIAQYHKSKRDVLRAATDSLAAGIPGGRHVPPALWDLLQTAPDYEPTWWGYDPEPTTTRAWTLADVGHPFVDLETVDRDDVDSALAQLIAYITRHPDAAPEILAALVAAQVATGQSPSREHLLRVLSAEAWLGGGEVVRGVWKDTGCGLTEWDSTLKIALAGTGALDGTPFAPLMNHPNTYSGKDKHGAALLIEVADRFRGTGDHAAEVRQLRNAAFVSLLAEGRYSTAFCRRVADGCDRVVPDSLAAKIARVYGDADPSKA